MNSLDQQFKNLLDCIDKHGQMEENRTGISAKTYPSYMIQHNMEDGFPLLTIKKMAFKVIAVELEGFLKGITSKKWFKDRKCNIWNEWCNPKKVPYSTDTIIQEKMKNENDLGPIYGFNFRAFGDYSYDLKEVEKRKPSELSLNYKPLFVETKTPQSYEITHYNVGYVGELTNCDLELYYKLKDVWEEMLRNCYDTEHDEYKNSGANGDTVCAKWLNFSEFYKDSQILTGFAFKNRNWDNFYLDKNHFSSKIYSPETCVWIPLEMKTDYSNIICFEAISPNNETFHHISISEFAKKHNLNSSMIKLCLLNKKEKYKKWKFKIVEDHGLRYTLPIDQFKNIVDSLKKNPKDRRMLCSAWNPVILDQMALMPCHVLWQVSVINNKLNLTWYQRSVDTLLGLPFNIASYGLLLHLLAKESGLQEGILTGFLNNVHVYENQLEGFNELLSRDHHYELPTIETSNFTNIYNWISTDTSVLNYESGAKISMPVAV